MVLNSGGKSDLVGGKGLSERYVHCGDMEGVRQARLTLFLERVNKA